MDTQAVAEKAYNFFTSQETGVLATVSASNMPEAATVGYVVAEGWNMYLLTHLNSRKVKNIETHPSVAFVVGTTLFPQTLQMEGTATILDRTSPYFSSALKLFDETKKLRKNPIFAVYKDNYTVIRIDVTWVRFLEFSQNNNAENYTVVFPKQSPSQQLPTGSRIA